MLHKRIFPQLQGNWKNTNLNTWACGAFNKDFPNPLIYANYCTDWVESVHKLKSCDYSYGGYMEDRSILWRGHYMKDGEFTHTGIDFNVPFGTIVHALSDCRVIDVLCDDDFNGGWGGRIVFQQNDGKVYLYGHLNKTSMLYDVQDYKNIKAGDVVGFIGDYNTNGNWYPHLHVQCIDLNLISLDKIDGYGKMSDNLSKLYPNPETYLRNS